MRHHLPAMHPRARTDVKDVIRLSDGFFVMLHHQHRIALIAQVFQRLQQPGIVALMQPDRGFIQNIKHPRQPRTNLTCQSNPLALPPRKRARSTRQRQVIQTNIVQKAQTLPDLLQDHSGNLIFLLRKVVWHGLYPRQSLADRFLHHLPHVLPGDFHRQRLRLQSIAAARATRPIILILLKLLAHPV